MPALPPSASPHFVSRRRRALSFVLACAIPALIVLMLLRLAVFNAPAPAPHTAPVVFDLAPDPEPTATPARAAPAGGGAPPPRAARTVAPPKATAAPPPAPTPTPVPAPAPPLDIIPLSREDFAAADIGQMARAPATAVGGGDAGTGSGGSGTGRGDSRGAGTGPGGEQLYNAEWVREPTHAELAFYLPRGAPQGAWAEIACHTLPGFRVDQCQELGQQPSGLGLAGAIRQAAWQFRVRPPRVGGRTLVGAWVLIRISFTGREP